MSRLVPLLVVLVLLGGGCSRDRSVEPPTSGASDVTSPGREAVSPRRSSSTPPSRPPAAAPLALVIGDSLVEQADETRQLLQALEEDGFQAEGGGTGGLGFAGGREQWRAAQRRDLDVLVIALGTNEAGEGAAAQGRIVLSDWLAAVPETCVVLVAVNETTSAWELDVYGPELNAMLRDVAAEHGDAHVVRWAPDPALLAADGIHLNEGGRAAYRQTILDGVRGC